MNNMKIIYVYGGDDYGAMFFEQQYGTDDESLNRAIKNIEANNGKLTVYGEEINYVAEVLEFGEIDPKFVDFIKNNIQDYDDSKHTNFYLVK